MYNRKGPAGKAAYKSKMRADKKFDRKMKIREGSAKDKKIDKLVGIKDNG